VYKIKEYFEEIISKWVMDVKLYIGISGLSALIAISIVLGISIYESKNSFAQTSSKNFTQTTKWTPFFNTTEWKSPYGTQRIFVLYESDKTILMDSQYPDLLFKAVDYAKADGFKVDDLIEYETVESDALGNPDVDLNFMVAMSKEK
jgi:hypothetical protein